LASATGGKFDVEISGDEAPAEGQSLLWLAGKLRGRLYTIKSVAEAEPRGYGLELAPAAGAPAIDASNQPRPDDRFVIAEGEIPARVAYVVHHGADLPAMVKLAGRNADELKQRLIAASVSRGRSLYLGPTAKCATCHGPQGKGDGDQTLAYQKIPGTNDEYPEPGLFDEWNNKIKPRDLTRGIYRGGRRPIDLYRRIYAGIKGTPMPAFGGTALNDDEIWDLVNYVMSVPYAGASPAGETPPTMASRRH
jgi:mono/diheme cytochrome c family protein